MLAVFDKLGGYAPSVLSVTRLMAGLIFLAHGTQKVLGFPASEGGPAMFSLPWIAGMFELVCGALIAVGWQTRPAAFVASGVMAFAYFIAHAPRDFYPVNNGGDAAILYCFLSCISFSRGRGHGASTPLRRETRVRALKPIIRSRAPIRATRQNARGGDQDNVQSGACDGGSRGIGEAISKKLKADGYTVAATYAGNDAKAAAFTEETGIKTYKWNVADYESSKPVSRRSKPIWAPSRSSSPMRASPATRRSTR